MVRPRLEDILLGMGAVDQLQLQSAVEYHRQWGIPLAKVVVEQGFCKEEQVVAALARQTGFSILDPEKDKPSPMLARLLSQRIAERHQVIPLRLEGKHQEVLVVAIAAPASLASLEAVRSVSGRQAVVPLVATDSWISACLTAVYEGSEESDVAPLTPYSSVAPLAEFDREEEAAPAPSSPIFLFGWPEAAAQNLALALNPEGFEARVVGHRELAGCIDEDVIVAPLQALEAVLARGQKLRGYLLVAVNSPEDMVRAQQVGARGYLATPVDRELMIRMIQRFHKA